ncbi:N-6 DNA methylase [Kluyvera sp. NPDC087067]|uniref:N-6 DNA methylase n=1 Tax=Kluyvera sp. NPDC087067 TaxID=3364105 RepID=UPI0038066219
MKNKNTLEIMLSIIKNEQKIINTEQAVKVISCLLIKKYLSLSLEGEVNIKHYNNAHNNDIIDCIEQIENILRRSDIIHGDNNRPVLKDLYYNLDELDKFISTTNLKNTLDDINSLSHLYNLRDDYAKLLSRMSDESGSSGAYYTPTAICELLTHDITGSPNDYIYDPACGTSGLLLSAFYNIKNTYKNGHLKIFGKDLSSFSCLLSLCNMLLNNIDNFSIECGNSIQCNNLDYKYNLIISNPPFGKIDTYNNDSMHKYLEYDFLEHIMLSLENNGNAVVILPNRFFSDEHHEAITLKKRLLSDFNVTKIISLPAGVFLPYTAVKTSILFFSKNGHTKQILVHDASTQYKITKSNPFNITHTQEIISSLSQNKNSPWTWVLNHEDLQSNYNFLVRPELHRERLSFNISLENINSLDENLNNFDEMLFSLKNDIKQLKDDLDHARTSNTSIKYNLEDLLIIKAGLLLQKNNLSEKGGVPVFGGNGIIGYTNEAKEFGETIVIGKVGALCGNVRYCNGDIWVTNNSMVVKSRKDDVVYMPYLAKLLNAMELRKLSSGTAQQYITVRHIKSIDINLPSIEIQKKIDYLLYQIEHKINLMINLRDKINSCSIHIMNDITCNLQIIK